MKCSFLWPTARKFAGMWSLRGLLILSLASLLYLFNLGGTSIYILDEAKNASCSMEMMKRQDWIVPTFNNTLRTDKPPLHYYMMMLSYSVGGIHSFTARIFSALAGILTIAVLFISVKKWASEQVAFLTALVALSSLQLTIQFHMAVPDPYLILWMTASFLFFYEGYHGKKTRAFLFMYLFIGLGFLTKGLIAVVFPVLVILLYLIVRRDLSWASLRTLNLQWGIPVFLVIVLPWYVAVGMETYGEWLKGFFWDHNVNRYTETREGHGGFLLAAVVYALAAILPFAVLVPAALMHAYRVRFAQPFFLFAALVVFAVVAFFSFSKTILPGYVGPAIPFISILVGGYLSAKIKEGRRMYGFFGVALLLALAFVIAAFVAGQRVGALAFLSDTWWFLLILPMGVLLSVYFSARGMIQRALLLLSISWASLSMLFFGVWYPTLDQQNPVVDSQSIRDLHADRVVVGYRAFNPAFVFNYRQPIPVLNSPGELQSFASAHPNILIVSQSRYLDELAGYRKIYHKQDLFERTETVVLIN